MMLKMFDNFKKDFERGFNRTYEVKEEVDGKRRERDLVKGMILMCSIMVTIIVSVLGLITYLSYEDGISWDTFIMKAIFYLIIMFVGLCLIFSFYFSKKKEATKNTDFVVLGSFLTILGGVIYWIVWN